MFRNYLKITFRNLLRSKVYGIINIFGLALGIACCLLITLFVQHELSYDRFHASKDRLYRALEVGYEPDGTRNSMAFQPLPMGPALEVEYEEVESAVRIFTGGGTVTSGDQTFAEDFIFTDPAFLEIFDFPLFQGDKKTALNDPSAVVVTRKIAEKYFGNENPIGKQIHVRTWRTEVDVVVSGVTENPPGNSSIQFGFLMHISQYPNYERDLNRWSNFNGSTYILLTEGADIRALEGRLPPFVDKYWGDLRQRQQERGRLAESNDALQLKFQPITSIHLDTSVNFSPEATSNPLYTYILSGIAMLVLCIACINFITLTVGRSATRSKEVGVRKVLGAQRSQLVRQFWGEAILLSSIALLLGLVLAELFLPSFNQLAEKKLELDFLSNNITLIAVVGLLLLVGLLAGSYPAAFLSGFQPVTVLKGGVKLLRKNLLTRVLVVFQFGLSIFLVVCTLMMIRQQHFVANRDLGYNAENVIAIRTVGGAGDEGEKRALRLRQALSGEASILGLAGCSAAFNKGWDINSFTHNEQEYSAFVYKVDYDYLDMLGIEIKEGRNFSPDRTGDVRNAVIINETFVDELKWQEPVVGRHLSGWNEDRIPGGPEVIGVTKDYHFLSLREKMRPVILLLDPDWPTNDILVRISSENMPETIDLISQKWRDVAPNTPFEYTFVDEDIRSQYAFEMRWQRIFTYSTIFAIMLACLGLFGLAALAAGSRTKEIGIRKVLGATVSRVAILLSRDFAILVLLANLIAWPFALWGVNKWLEHFAYRIDVGWWVFVLSGGLALLIAIITVSTQAIRAAVANPVDSLRYE